MSEFRSHKWISSGKGKALNVHKVQNVFGSVAKNPCNLISIFGRARQGKSFLMNCLAGEREIFKISNEKDSCTQGIDISNKWLSLSDFSKVDGGKLIGGRTEGIRIGFVDAEGQGDKDVSYDANLICPILLASKCVIFNWKGDLQKDNILSTLGIMARAAQNIAAESSSSSSSAASSSAAGASGPKFGHLHIVFRDWQAVKSDEADVFQALLGIEGTTEGTTRDLIRADLLSSFESIRVWLFEPPSEFTKDLKQKLIFEKTSNAFRRQVRELREALAQQLKEPTCVAGNVLTGRAYGPLTEQIAEALNSGQVVLPSSAYLNMMRQEALQLAHHYEADLKAQMQQLLTTINAPFVTVSGATWSTMTKSEVYITRDKATAGFAALVQALSKTYQSRIADTVGNLTGPPGSPIATILTKYATQTQGANDSLQQQFLALFHQQFTQWLMRARKAAEEMLSYQIGILDKKLPIADDNSAHALSFTQELEQIRSSALRVFGGVTVYGTECNEVVDAEEIFNRHFHTLEAGVRARNAQLFAASRGVAEGHLKKAMDDMQAALDETVVHLIETRPSGYLMVTLEETLNQEYNSLKKVLQQHLSTSPHKNDILSQFDRDCVALRARMVQKYSLAKDKALDAAVRHGHSAIDACFAAFDVNHLWQNTPLDECELKLTTCVTQLAQDVEESVKQNYAAGWLLNAQYAPVMSQDPEIAAQAQLETRFLAALHTAVDKEMQAFLARWQAELEQRKEAAEMERLALEEEAQEQEQRRQREQDETVSMEEFEGSDNEEESDQVSSPAPSKASAVVSKKNSKATKDSAAEQKRKAQEWAAKQFGAKPAAPKRVKKAVQQVPKKSVEQQRADALDYAKRLYGEQIGLPSPPAKLPPSSTMTSVSSAGAGSSADANPFSGGKAPTFAVAATSSGTISAAAVKSGSKRRTPDISPDDSDQEDRSGIAGGAGKGGSASGATSGRKQPRYHLTQSQAQAPRSANKKDAGVKAAPAAPPIPAPAPVPAEPAVKVDPVKAAREEAKRLAQERMEAAAAAAVNKVNKSNAAKKAK